MTDHPVVSLPFPDPLYRHNLRLLSGKTFRSAHLPFQQAVRGRQLLKLLLRSVRQRNISRQTAFGLYIFSCFHHKQTVFIIQTENQNQPTSRFSSQQLSFPQSRVFAQPVFLSSYTIGRRQTILIKKMWKHGKKHSKKT